MCGDDWCSRTLRILGDDGGKGKKRRGGRGRPPLSRCRVSAGSRPGEADLLEGRREDRLRFVVRVLDPEQRLAERLGGPGRRADVRPDGDGHLRGELLDDRGELLVERDGGA